MLDEFIWIPDISYFDHKIKCPIDSEKAVSFIKKKIDSGEIFKSNEDLFWTITLLHQINRMNLIDSSIIKDYILSLKCNDGGYKFSATTAYSDTLSTFYCLSVLKLLNFDELIDERDLAFIKGSQNLDSNGDGGFFHCRSPNCSLDCKRKTMVKYSFLTLSTLISLDKLDIIDKEKLVDYLNKSITNDINLIYKIFSLKYLKKSNSINLEKIIPTILSWQIKNSGFGIDSEIPSIEHIFWIIICLEKLNKLTLINFEGVFNFIKNMQNDIGGFMDQYMGLGSTEPTIKSSVLALFCANILWKRLLESIENEFLSKASVSTEIDLIPISKKFSIPLEIVIVLIDWLLFSKWIEGEFSSRYNHFQIYFEQQNKPAQEIIVELIKANTKNQEQNEFNLSEFSKNFNISNSLEQINIITNDLIINKFLHGELTTIHKDLILLNPLVLKDYIRLTKPFKNYNKIVKEKKKILKAKNRLLTILPIFNNLYRENKQYIKILIDQEKLSEAKLRVNKYHKFVLSQIKKVEETIKNINENNNFIKPYFLNDYFERYWPYIRNTIEMLSNSFKEEFDEKIKLKEEYIKQRIELTKNQIAITELKGFVDDTNKNLDLSLYELHEFFLKNFVYHEKIYALIKHNLCYIEDSNKKIESKISELLYIIKFNDLKKDIDIINTNWINKSKNTKINIEKYQIIIDKRGDLKKYIDEKVSILKKYNEEKNNHIFELIKKNKLNESSILITEFINEFDSIISELNEIFYVNLSQINKEIFDFPKYNNDIKSEWIEKRENEKSRWNELVLGLEEKIHLSKKLNKKNELQQIIDDKTKDIYDLIKNMKDLIIKLIESKNLIDAENKLKYFFDDANEKIKRTEDDFKEFVKTTTIEYKKFRVLTKDLILEWEEEKEYVLKLLNETITGFKKKIEDSTFQEKKFELFHLIETHIADVENKSNKIKFKFNNAIESEDILSDLESEFDLEITRIKNVLNSYDNHIFSFIKTSNRGSEAFNEIIKDDVTYWNNGKLKTIKNLEEISKVIKDEIFIQKLQSLIKAFEKKEVDVNYLSKVFNIKLEPLKMKLINLISESKIKGKLDSNAQKFIMIEDHKPEKFVSEELKIFESEAKTDLKEQIKDEILKLRYIIVVHANIGASLYSRKLGDWNINSDIIGGFLTAIQNFSSEINKKKILIESLKYQDFEILIAQGTYIFTALFINGKESDWLRNKTKLFIEEFERNYQHDLKYWKGELNIFKNSSYLIDKTFETYRVQEF